MHHNDQVVFEWRWSHNRGEIHNWDTTKWSLNGGGHNEGQASLYPRTANDSL